MIIDNKKSDVEVYGDIKSYKTYIDPKNIDFITTLLSSNLYSNPERSFLREIVSNGWDSEVEAGTTDMPVIVKIDTGSVSIRDYGTGISPERFREIYCGIGSSTKRDSNDYIGGFGIGKFSALACSNTVYITSYYNGVAYLYIMVKEGNSITFNLASEDKTDERNGVEVLINTPDPRSFVNELSYLTFFPNIYIDYGSNLEGFDININNVKKKSFKYFAYANAPISHKILLGNVLYPLDLDKFYGDGEITDFLFQIKDSGVVLKFDVGELEITPNRENVIYTESSIKLIKKRISQASKEVEDIITSTPAHNTASLKEYADLKFVLNFYDFIENKFISLSQSNGAAIKVSSDYTGNVHYKGKSLSTVEFNVLVSCLTYIDVPHFRANVRYGSYLSKKDFKTSLNSVLSASKESRCLIIKDNRITSSMKLYIKNELAGSSYNYPIFGFFSEEDLWNSFISYKLESKGTVTTDRDTLIKRFLPYRWIINELYRELMSNAPVVNLETDPDYLEYKEGLSESYKLDTLNVRVEYSWVNPSWDSLGTILFRMKSRKSGIVLVSSRESLPIARYAKARGFEWVRVRKDIISKIKKLNLNFIIDDTWLLHSDPLLSEIRTLLEVCNNHDISMLYPLREDFNRSFIGTIPDSDKEVANRILHLLNIITSSDDYRALCMTNGTVDKDLYAEFDKIMSKCCIFRKVRSMTINNIGSNSLLLIGLYIMKEKLYRISYELYDKIRKDRLLKVLLCRN